MVELAEDARRLEAVIDAQLAAGAVAIGVDGRLGHAQFAGDLLGAEMLVDEAQAITLSRSQHIGNVRYVSQRPLQSLSRSKRRLSADVYFDERIHAPRAVL